MRLLASLLVLALNELCVAEFSDADYLISHPPAPGALSREKVGPESGEQVLAGGRRVGVERQRAEAAVPDDGEEPPDRRLEGRAREPHEGNATPIPAGRGAPARST